MSRDFKTLEERIGYQFQNKDILKQAFVHPSMIGTLTSAVPKASTSKSQGDKLLPHYSYERMEFLGDRVLGLQVSSWLFEIFAHEPEGRLAKRFSALVKTQTLASISRQLSLVDFVLLSPGELQVGTPQNESFLADICEVLIGALYLDGGIDVVQSFVRRFWKDIVEQDLNIEMDPKSALQEWCQASNLGLPVYETKKVEGSQHAPFFTVSVTVPGFAEVSAKDKSKKAAAKKAAELMMLSISNKDKL